MTRPSLRPVWLGLLLLACLTSASAITPAQEARRIAMRDSVLALIHGAPSQSDAPGRPAQPRRSVVAFGAKGDGIKDCRPAFARAMQAAARSGGRGLHLVVPAGTYLLRGPIHLVSDVTIELEQGATLRFSPDPDCYLPTVTTSWEGTFCHNYSPLIYGFGLHDVAIIGQGTIDGNAATTFATWRERQRADQQQSRAWNHAETPVADRRFGKGHLLRPHLIQLFACEGVTLSGVLIMGSPFWCVHLLKCRDVICRGLRYDARLVNNDGIDPEMTQNLLIEDIAFDNGDDNVAIKAGRDNDGWPDRVDADPVYRPCPTSGIIIRRCRFKGLHGVVIGSEMSAGVEHVFVEDCTCGGYLKRGLYVKTNPNRGGFVRDVYMTGCTFGEVEDLCYITSMYAGEGADDHHFTDVRDIHVADVTCRQAHGAAIVLQGTEARPLSDISFERVTVPQAAVGFSSTHTLDVSLRDCHLGGIVNGAPTQVTEGDRIFRP